MIQTVTFEIAAVQFSTFMKVFVSSTFIDLKDHRKAVEEVLHRIRLQFQGMEYFGARPYEPKRACLSEIEASAVFIGIYAHRYGYVPAGDSKSITEQEFDFAQHLKLPCYCYVVDPVHPWPPTFIEHSAKEQLQRFITKVSGLVRERFTSPDDLAKKVAADLSRELQSEHFHDLNGQVIGDDSLREHCRQEIDTTIGPKYLRQLYVARRLDGDLRQFPKAILKSALAVKRQLRAFQDLLNKTDLRPFKEDLKNAELAATEADEKKRHGTEVRKNAETRHAYAKKQMEDAEAQEEKTKSAAAEQDMKAASSEIDRAETEIRNAETEHQKAQLKIGRLKELISSVQSLESAASPLQQTLDGLSGAPIKDSPLWYPARLLTQDFGRLQSIIGTRITGLRSSFPEIDKSSEALMARIEKLKVAMRPIYLVVDRAGGGKTNLLCHMAEEFGGTVGCMFVSAKSIPEATDHGIVAYFSSAYPFGSDPIKSIVDKLRQDELPLVVVIDGINENANPADFNAAIKAFVRRYYGMPVRFVISCRDIYWEYFGDEWWNSHCSHLSTNDLYSFTSREFRKALPLYLKNYDIEAEPVGNAKIQLAHPLLLRFYCEAFRGIPGNPSKMGRVNDIRLLDLFEAYCARKFRQIQQRLQLLRADEIFEYLRMIATMMLDGNERSISVRKVAQKARTEFGESSIRTLQSRYVQILDEDILLEEKPVGSATNLNVSFVYEEFMEFIIAKSLWSELDGNPVTATGAIALAEHLMKKEKQFISVLGVLLYIGELLAAASKREGLRFVDWLIASEREDLACRIVESWPSSSLDEEVFQTLISMHSQGRTAKVKNLAWNSLAKLCEIDWKLFFNYVKTMPLVGYFRPMNVFSVIGRLGGGTTPEQRIETLRWMLTVVNEGRYIPKGVLSADLRNTVVAVHRIVQIGKPLWTSTQRAEATKILRKILHAR